MLVDESGDEDWGAAIDKPQYARAATRAMRVDSSVMAFWWKFDSRSI